MNGPGLGLFGFFSIFRFAAVGLFQQTATGDWRLIYPPSLWLQLHNLSPPRDWFLSIANIGGNSRGSTANGRRQEIPLRQIAFEISGFASE